MAKTLFLCVSILLLIPRSRGSSLTNEGNVIACDALNNMDDRLFLIENTLRSVQKKVQASNSFEAALSNQLSILDKKLNILTNVEAKINELDSKLEKVLIKIGNVENDVEHLKFSSGKSNIKSLNETIPTSIIEKKNQNELDEISVKINVLDQSIEKSRDELKFEMDGLDRKLNSVPLRLDEILIKINVLEETSKRINNNLEKQNEKEVLENVLNKINNVENNTEYLKNCCAKSNMNNTMNIEKGNEPKGTNNNIIITAETLTFHKLEDYTLCNSVRNQSGLFKFHTNSTNLIEKSRDYSVRLCRNGWLVIQNRNSFDYQENFNRSWNDYKHGFGDLRKEFWIGNDFLHRLTYTNHLMLRIELESFNNEFQWAEYDFFKVDSEYENYRLKIGGFTGTFIDSFDHQNKMQFTTYDRDNDLYNGGNCATTYGGGWWFNVCYFAFLNGLYNKVPLGTVSSTGVAWHNGVNFINFKSAKMMVKPKISVIQLNDLTYNRYNPL